MASKKILLEVLTTDRNRVAPAPPRPKKDKEERRREKRASRPISLPHPTTQSLLLVLAGVVVMVVAYGVGFWRGRNAGSTPPDLSTAARVPDLLDRVGDEPVPPKPIAPNPPPAKSPSGLGWVVQLVSYEKSPKNETLALHVKDELTKAGLPHAGAWEVGGMFVVTVGSFATKDDPALAALLARVKEMPFEREKAPFAGARIRELQ
ncbi:MAG: hypothetical protein L0323_16655 [Planctomycetes bacterium]|nr:hypothetical protein [Planctomycetota bacterium]